MRTRREPAWWMLFGLLPLMGGLFVVESRLSLPPGWHQGVQIALILVIYGLVWVWLWVNDRALLYDGHGSDDKGNVHTASGAVMRSLGPDSIPHRADVSDVRGRPVPRRIMTRVNPKEIRQCSHSLGRRSSRSCS
jgi:hypothetical protein